MYLKIIGSCLFLLAALVSCAQPEMICINQSGYYPFASKIAVVTGERQPGKFYLIDAQKKDTVFTSTLSNEFKSTNSSVVTRKADFSSFNKVGNYVLYVPGVGNSYPFSIRSKQHLDVAKSSLKAFYYQRVSEPLPRAFAGRWARPAGHPDTVVLVHPAAASPSRPAGTKIASPGGWYDAGDYNKYIVNSGITMGTLLSAYEDYSSWFDTLSLNIPESKDRVPDILNEVLCNLRWMMTMQDPEDGGVYHKCTNAAFDGMVMPGVTRLPRFVMPKSTAATLDFAAVMAQSARVFAGFSRQLPKLADSCLRAAERAWQWAQKNPATAYDQNAINKNFQPPVSTGAYGDRNFNDEWMWAASELLITTGYPKYRDMVISRIADTLVLPGWPNVGALGYYSILRHSGTVKSQLGSALSQMKQQLIKLADSYTKHVDNSAFHTVMGRSPRDFVWGSSAVAANQGILLLNAYHLTKNKTYATLALQNLDYLMGRNATGYCFVTGAGSKSPQHPHHRPSVADGIDEPIPGFLVGGPNPGKQDGCRYAYSEPETTYTDLDCSFASNEIAINWNAPMVYLANALEALQYKVGYSK